LSDQLLKQVDTPLQEFSFSRYFLGGVSVDLISDDEALRSEVGTTLGEPVADSGRPHLRARFRRSIVDRDHGLLDLECDDRSALTPDDLLLGLESADFPFRRCEPYAKGWTSFAFMDDPQPLLSFRGEECVVWQRDRWRAAIGFLLLHRIYRLRRDAIFFHASSVDIGGEGVIFIGRKGAGKSTTSLALASRGIPLLGDEIACYRPADGSLEPFLRPVGIKPGPRAARVNDGLRRAGIRADDEIVRVDVRQIMDATRGAAVPLRNIVFLDPFLPAPRLTRVETDRGDLHALQPVVSSLVNAPRTQRVFEMARMLSSVKIYRLAPGEPDATAELIVSVLGGEG